MWGEQEISQGERMMYPQDISDCKEAAQQRMTWTRICLWCGSPISEAARKSSLKQGKFWTCIFWQLLSSYWLQDISMPLILSVGWEQGDHSKKTYLPSDLDIFSLSTAAARKVGCDRSECWIAKLASHCTAIYIKARPRNQTLAVILNTWSCPYAIGFRV